MLDYEWGNPLILCSPTTTMNPTKIPTKTPNFRSLFSNFQPKPHKQAHLSPLFEEKKREESGRKGKLGILTRPASSVISKLEEVAKSMKFSVKKSDSGVDLKGIESGRKGKLGISAEIFVMAPSFLVVEVKKSSGDTLEYNQFCSKELRPALKDIVWGSPTDSSTDY